MIHWICRFRHDTSASPSLHCFCYLSLPISESQCGWWIMNHCQRMWEVMIRGSDVGNAHPQVLLVLSKAKEALKEEREMLKQPLWEHWNKEFGALDLILFDQSWGGLVVRFSLNRDCFNGHIFSWLHWGNRRTPGCRLSLINLRMFQLFRHKMPISMF